MMTLSNPTDPRQQQQQQQGQQLQPQQPQLGHSHSRSQLWYQSHPPQTRKRKVHIMSPVSIFLIFSCVALCTSEALVSSSTPFLPLRGGASSSASGVGGSSNYGAADSSTAPSSFGVIRNQRRRHPHVSSSSPSPLSLYAGDVSDDVPADFVNGAAAGGGGGGRSSSSSPAKTNGVNGSSNSNSVEGATSKLNGKRQPAAQQKLRLAKMPRSMPGTLNGYHHQQQQQKVNGVMTPATVTMSISGGATAASTTTASAANLNGRRNGNKTPQRQPPSSSSSSSSSQTRSSSTSDDFHLDRDAGEVWVDQPIPAEFVAETNLPTDIGQFRLRAYRSQQSDTNEYVGREPSVIYSPDHPPFGSDGQLQQNVPVRIHDQCITSEVFGSQRCDCSQQLKMALQEVAENGGCVIYLQQEGRGIGLANKVAAYSLQDVGLDTVDANLHLGFPEDARQYGVIPSILDDMQIGSVKLMTNNPRKVDRLRSLGILVDSTIPMVVPETTPYNYRYMEAKHDRMNHTNLSPLLFVEDKNGKSHLEAKEMPSLAETYISEGEEMAANAVQVSLNLISEDGVASPVKEDETQQEGVKAQEDGYCFGRQSVEDAVKAVREGKMVVVVDDMDRENEGDLIMAADACTPEDMAKIVRYSSGVICIAMDGERMDKLGLPPMLTNNEDPKGTAFTVTVDATKDHGITTGISATDRARTVNLLADPDAKPTDFARPGHIFPLRARDGGVLTRDGHTEAAVDLSALAGRHRSGILCEIVSEENPTEMARLPELKRFCREHGFVLTSIVDIAQYRRDTEGLVDDDNDDETDLGI